MRSLFLKIFLSYWLAFALFLVTTILLTLALRPPRETNAVEAQQEKLLTEAVEAYKAGGADGFRTYAHGVREAQHVHIFLFNQGRDVTGRTPPEWIDRVEHGQIHTADSIWGRFGPMQFLRPALKTTDGHSYSLVIELPPERGRFGPHGIPGLGILIAVICSGLVCYILTRYLTSPIVRLRAATQKLAAGDLTARADSARSRGHDEMSELVRDFDVMAERLEILVNSQGRLLKDISHELRSPLARLNVALALARQRTGPEAESALDRIDREAVRLNELIGRLMTIVRLESGGEALRKVPVHLEDLIRDIAADAAFEAQSRNCRVEVSMIDGCEVIGDPSLLNSAIENVVRNAVRYTQENSAVEVQLECVSDGQVAFIRISDYGPGVPEDALDKLFRPFYRIDDARGRGTGGVGLGLAIAERAVTLHGGTIKAVNRSNGGLTVEIRLPAQIMAGGQVAAVEPVLNA